MDYPQQYDKLILEIRYPVQIEMYDNKSNIINEFWNKDFENWVIENIYSIRLHNGQNPKSNVESLLIEPKRMGYHFEAVSGQSTYQENSKKFLRWITKKLKCTSIDRIGVRSISCINGIKFEDSLQKAYESKLFREDFNKIAFPDTKYPDFALTLQTENGRFNFGPMKKVQNHPLLSEFSAREHIMEDFMFYDYDAYETDIKISKTIPVFDALFLKVTTMISDFHKFIKDK